MAVYGVYGLGKSGKATVDYLLAHGHEVFAWDDNAAAREGIACVELANWDWGKIAALVLSPGIPLTNPQPHPIVELARQHGKNIICDIELLWLDNQNSTFIGITGTNGKSTTTALIAHIMQENGYDIAVGGNLGMPALTLGKHKYYVLEMSSYQLDLIDKTSFDIAVWLNISPDHLDRHGNLEGYVSAKKNIFKNKNHTLIIGRDDDHSKKILAEYKGAIAISRYDKTGEFPQLPGEHNQQNISAAYHVGKALGIPHKNIIRAIGSFPGLEHRMKKVAEIRGVTYINDSKATNADSTSNALAAYDNIYWIAGGVPKAGGIASLEKYFPRIAKAYLIGQASDDFAATLKGKVEFEKSGDLQTAVAHAAAEAKNSVVLLSPACASFDQFGNFEERGAFFKKLVLELPRK